MLQCISFDILQVRWPCRWAVHSSADAEAGYKSCKLVRDLATNGGMLMWQDINFDGGLLSFKDSLPLAVHASVWKSCLWNSEPQQCTFVPFNHCNDWQSNLSLYKLSKSCCNFLHTALLFSHKWGHFFFFALCCSLEWLTEWIETGWRFGVHQWAKAGLKGGAFMVLALVSCANRKPIPSSVLRIKRGEWFSFSILCFHLFFVRFVYLLLSSWPGLILPPAFSTTHSHCGFKQPGWWRMNDESYNVVFVMANFLNFWAPMIRKVVRHLRGNTFRKQAEESSINVFVSGRV